ncbi:MAG: phosphoglycerate dehydrogenase [Chlorobium sp.]|uniref:phosphoglycerate dehydrogenase n=1 Tax=Chlorobium sp. TaxID=1095 RepID=UPI0025C55823|nr:phosphoglycerate dehydrogenase [Chlorobium sp.]MCF8382831.1 phosphoglycerate dehydrogenase [Chlorobium sp.]
MKVLITDGVDRQCAEILERNGFDVTEKPKISKEELKEIIGEFDKLIVRSATKVTSEIIECGKNLKLIGRAGAGVDNIDIEAATRHGIIVMNTPGGNTVSAAEHACGMLMAAARMIPQATAELKAGLWNKKKFTGIELEGKTISIIGLGKIGREVASRMQAFGMKTIAYDPMIPDEYAAHLNIELLPLHENFSRADVITIHSSLNESTRNLISNETFALMKEGVIIINCARGGIVNEEDLADAITSGKVAAAALDVFESEPVNPDNPLLKLERVIVTPHIAASTNEAQQKVAVQIAEQIVEWKQKGKLEGAVNASAVELAQAPGVASYLMLAEKLGSTLAQITPLEAHTMTIRTSGEYLQKYSEVIAAAALKGFLDVRQSSDTNYINVFTMAAEMGITLEQKFEKENPDYTNLIRVELENGTKKRMIGGTVFGDKAIRIVMIDQFLVEFKPEGTIIIYNNIDKPGVIANVTQHLLQHNLNVAYVALSRDEEKLLAMTAIVVDGNVETTLLNEIKQVDGVSEAAVVSI